ncbi:MAG: ABC transporter permease [Candidatus Altiarchaeota archaeon]
MNYAPIYVMWLRQLKRYWRSKPRLLGSLGQPVLFLVAFGFGFSPIFEKAGAGNYLQFLAPGVIAMSILFTSMFTGIEVVWDRKFGFLKETLVAPIPRTSIMVGRTLGGATVAVAQGSVVLVMTLIIGFRPVDVMMLPLAVVYMALIALLFTAVGTAIASRIEDMQAFPLIMNFLIMPLFFLSGALFPMKDLPPFLDTIMRLNPLSYGVDGLRGTLSGEFIFSLSTDLSVLAVLALAVGLIGSYLFSKIEI